MTSHRRRPHHCRSHRRLRLALALPCVEAEGDSGRRHIVDGSVACHVVHSAQPDPGRWPMVAPGGGVGRYAAL
eukprot:4841587-Prymnesium_polylepis.1